MATWNVDSLRLAAPHFDDVLGQCDVLCLQETAHCAGDTFRWLHGWTVFSNAQPGTKGRMVSGADGRCFGLLTLVRAELSASVVQRGARCLVVEVRGRVRPTRCASRTHTSPSTSATATTNK